MVLPSNASLRTFPDNRPGLYRIRLPEMMHLQGHWKVGLMNLIFPSTFAAPNIEPLAIMVSLGNIETTYGPFNITLTSIETVGDLMFDDLTLEKKAAEHGLNLSDHITICFFSKGYTIVVEIEVEIRTFRGSTLGFNAYLERKLGLLTDNSSVPVDYYDSVVYREYYVFILQESVVRLNLGQKDTLSVVSSLKERVLNLAVYADIVEPHPVGDTQANRLRVGSSHRSLRHHSTLDCHDRISIL